MLWLLIWFWKQQHSWLFFYFFPFVEINFAQSVHIPVIFHEKKVLMLNSYNHLKGFLYSVIRFSVTVLFFPLPVMSARVLHNALLFPFLTQFHKCSYKTLNSTFFFVLLFSFTDNDHIVTVSWIWTFKKAFQRAFKIKFLKLN